MEISEEVYLIVSKDKKLVAKGTPRSRYICHVDENDNKRYLTYKNEKIAKNAASGFSLSDKATEYIKENHQ